MLQLTQLYSIGLCIGSSCQEDRKKGQIEDDHHISHHWFMHLTYKILSRISFKVSIMFSFLSPHVLIPVFNTLQMIHNRMFQNIIFSHVTHLAHYAVGLKLSITTSVHIHMLCTHLKEITNQGSLIPLFKHWTLFLSISLQSTLLFTRFHMFHILLFYFLTFHYKPFPHLWILSSLTLLKSPTTI